MALSDISYLLISYAKVTSIFSLQAVVISWFHYKKNKLVDRHICCELDASEGTHLKYHFHSFTPLLSTDSFARDFWVWSSNKGPDCLSLINYCISRYLFLTIKAKGKTPQEQKTKNKLEILAEREDFNFSVSKPLTKSAPLHSHLITSYQVVSHYNKKMAIVKMERLP